MRFLIQVALTTLLSSITAQVLPWWSLVICAALVALGLDLNKRPAFWGGFVAISLLWIRTATWIDTKTNAILSSKIAPLLGLQHPIMLILLTGLLGGLMGGLGALRGQQIRALLTHQTTRQPPRRYY